MLTCKRCGAAVDLTMSFCSCGAGVPMAHLAAILGVVCRGCEAHNDPGAHACVACGEPLGLSRPTGDAPPVRGSPPATAARGPRPAAPPLEAPAPSGEVTVPRPAPLPAPAPASAPAPAPPPAPPPAPASAPAPAPSARLVLERGDAPPGSAFRLEGEQVLAGRTQGQIVFPDDACLAPHHATFLLRDGAVLVRDECEAGGIYIRLRGTSAHLRPGSLFAVGDRLLRFAGPLAPLPPQPADGTRPLGAPRPEGRAVLVEEWLEGGICGRVHVRVGPSITIGRAGCSINLGEDPYLSQAHAEILVEPDGSAKLHDLGSSNGTFFRLPTGGERELRDGDGLRLGREVLRVEVG